jgi:hypothetical protein
MSSPADTLYDLTPTTLTAGMWFKREDLYQPFLPSRVNGSKLRQAIYLVDKQVKQHNITGVVSGAVGASPQHAFISTICQAYGIGCIIVSGTKEVAGHEYLELAQQNGAFYHHSKVGYAKTLQATAEKIAAKMKGHWLLETNITLDEKRNSAAEIEQFHRVGAFQVQNIPDAVDTLIIPAGSCNSATSVLHGLTMYQNAVKRVVLMGIGHYGSKDIHYVQRRLESFNPGSRDTYDWGIDAPAAQGRIKIEYYNLNGSGFCSYADLMPEQVADIDFHPRYEGKIIRYFKQHPELRERYWNKGSMFWVVGGKI